MMVSNSFLKSSPAQKLPICINFKVKRYYLVYRHLVWISLVLGGIEIAKITLVSAVERTLNQL